MSASSTGQIFTIAVSTNEFADNVSFASVAELRANPYFKELWLEHLVLVGEATTDNPLFVSDEEQSGDTRLQRWLEDQSVRED